MKIDKDKVLFLLGGHDLEMITIRDILDEHDIQYFDESQKWGAKLSDYSKRLEENSDKQFYAVELVIDDKSLLEKYKIEIIDHHNEYSDREASLLQVLKLLDIETTREYELVAVNDVNHIEGLKCLGVSGKQIKSIRELDRRAQGIEKSQEKIAIKEILQIEKGEKLSVIKTSLDTFTPIVDFCDIRPLLVYNNKAVMYYGDITKLKEKYKEQIENNEAFHGKKYFGFDKKYLSSKNIDKYVEAIVKLVNSEKKDTEVYSYHTFMMPFRFDKITEVFSNTYDYYQDINISERVSIDNVMKKLLEKDGWEHKPFKIESNFDYNEYAYFYSYIRETLYNKEEFSENNTSYFFEKESHGGKYNIQIKDYTYELELEGLSLRIFETGIAILSIEVSNRKFSQSKIEDILKINDFGRRIYAPFLGKMENEENWTQAAKNSQLPKKVTVILADKTVYEDTFCNEYIGIPNEINITPYILKLLGLKTFTTQKDNKGQYFIQPIIDDRMFVLSWYANDEFSQDLKKHKYIKNDKWYEYVFVDGDGLTVCNKKMQEKLIENSTYDRWMDNEYGLTLFGLSRYSFVCIANKSDFSKETLLPHMKTMYFQMFTLLLAIRASTLRFSEEVTALSNVKNEDEDDFSEKVSQLYKYYIKFVNKIYFREITAQEQGIELYDKASELMNIERDVKDLDAEIAELHTYVSMKAEEKQLKQGEKREQRLETISKLGAVFLPPSLIAGIYGMNIFDFNQSYMSFIIVLLLMLASAVGSYMFISKKEGDEESTDKEKKLESKELKKMIMILSTLMLIIILFVSFFGTKKNMTQDVNVINSVNIQPLIKEKIK